MTEGGSPHLPPAQFHRSVARMCVALPEGPKPARTCHSPGAPTPRSALRGPDLKPRRLADKYQVQVD